MDSVSIYFWEPSISPHKAALFNALSKDVRLVSSTYVAQTELSDARKALGWSPGVIPKEKIILYTDKNQVDRIVASSPENSIHLFSGTHWIPCIVEGIAAVIRHNRRFGLMTEPRASEGLKGALRYVHSWLTEGPIRRHADFVLAIGRHGPSWFENTGYSPEKIFPFAYFLAGKEYASDFQSSYEVSNLTQVSFVGRLARSKGLEDFLNAIPSMRIPIQVRIAGAGPDKALVDEAIQRFKNISYVGVLPMEDVGSLLRGTDILVLPSTSTDDGWGVVVSEALLAGAAVVATNCVGASICLDDSFRGRVVSVSSPSEIAMAIDDLAASIFLSGECRQRRSAWANAHLTGVAGAEYLFDVLENVYSGGERPKPFYL